MSNRNNAYKEVYVILQELEKNEYDKIPSEVIEALKENMNEEYEFELDDELELKEQELLPETKAIIFNLFRDYLATPEQKEKIIEMQNEERQKLNSKKEQKYSIDVFESKESKEEHKGEHEFEEEMSLAEYNENIFIKILNKIRRLFKKK